MANSKYWQSRLQKIAHSAYNDQEKRNLALLKTYKDTYNDIQGQLDELYRKYAENEVLSTTEMYKFNRMNDLQKNIKVAVKSLGQDEEKFLGKSLYTNYKDVYQNTGQFIKDNSSVKIDWSMLPDKEIEKAITQNWSGEMFSDRIWKNKDRLVKKLNNTIVSGIAQGKSGNDMASDIKDAMGTGVFESVRLVRTETMHIINSAQLDTYKKAGASKAIWIAAEDERTCEECGELDGQSFDIEDAPDCPAHANCRCTICADPDSISLDDEDTSSDSNNSNDEINSESDETSGENSDILENNDKPVDDYFDALNLKPVAVEGLANIHNELNEYSTENHKEKLITMNIDGTKGMELTGNGNSVVFTNELIEHLTNSKENSLILSHNHPGSSSFSDADLKVMAKFNSINGITVEGQNGTKYICKIGDGVIPDNLSQITKDYNEIKNELFDEYRAKVLTDEMTPDEAWYEHSNEVMQQLADKYNWIYRRIKSNER